MTADKDAAAEDELEDLELAEADADGVTGGSNIMKTKHDAAKNSISNVR